MSESHRRESGRPRGLTVRAAAISVVALAFGACTTAGAALLLYTGQGFLRAAGFMLGLTLAALAAGVWVGGAGTPRPNPRWRWLLLVAAWSVAAIFASMWFTRESLRASPWGGALAVLLILAEPSYLAGTLLVALGPARRSATSTTVAASAIMGAALGVLLASTIVIPRWEAPYVFLGAAIVLTVMAAVDTAFGPSAPSETETMMLENQVILVTGVGHPGQVGYLVARRLLDAGARVVISDRSGTAAELASELGPPDRVFAVAADLTDSEAVQRLVAAGRAKYGRLDAVVNVAGGLSVTKPVAETSPEEWRREIERNADTAFRVSHAALPLLRESKGAIVNFASPAGRRAVRNLAAYSAGKAAVIALTRALALEERDHGVRVNAIAPGMIDTAQNWDGADQPENVRWVTRDQIADVVVFLLSKQGSGVNGEVVHVVGPGVS